MSFKDEGECHKQYGNKRVDIENHKFFLVNKYKYSLAYLSSSIECSK